jgi:hypothetical protein
MALLVHAGLSIALAAAGKPFGESLAMLFHFPGVALKVFGWVTIIFAALDLFGGKIYGCEDWDPLNCSQMLQRCLSLRTRISYKCSP